MNKEKFRISLQDFMPYLGKIPIGMQDMNEQELHVGDIVKDAGGDKYFIGYRYGQFMVKQPHTIHSIMPKDFHRYERISEVWAVLPGEWIIIGWTDEPFYEKVKELDNMQLIPQS